MRLHELASPGGQHDRVAYGSGLATSEIDTRAVSRSVVTPSLPVTPVARGNRLGNYGPTGVIVEITPSGQIAWRVDSQHRLLANDFLLDHLYALSRGPKPRGCDGPVTLDVTEPRSLLHGVVGEMPTASRARPIPPTIAR